MINNRLQINITMAINLGIVLAFIDEASTVEICWGISSKIALERIKKTIPLTIFEFSFKLILLSPQSGILLQ
ncbi:hypothetical protein GCM10009865_10250 [Aeromicrobium ponti]|uniref:hypothetical protein n=1 Tax=Cytobacillus oceanisediminis TaxID=665099 RepID=UPI001F54E436|nr:hypothetical protein [Cytobacillus oceanisediminis]